MSPPLSGSGYEGVNVSRNPKSLPQLVRGSQTLHRKS